MTRDEAIGAYIEYFGHINICLARIPDETLLPLIEGALRIGEEIVVDYDPDCVDER